jgi:hypothetical protein
MTLLVETTLVFLEVLAEHVLATELMPSPEMVYPHVWQHTVSLENPINLFLLAPH